MGRKNKSGLSSGVYGQLSLENFTLKSILNQQKASSGYLLKNNIYPHKLPMTGQLSNSNQVQRDENGKIIRIRYYDENGNAYKDVDYDDHGRPDRHKVPHTHIIDITNIIHRKKGVLPYANR